MFAKRRRLVGTREVGFEGVRISTTVDERLLTAAREARAGVNDSALVDEALTALLARDRAAEIVRGVHRVRSPPARRSRRMGDLASFRAAAGPS